MCTHRLVKKVDRIINMTSEPIRLYDSLSGEIVIFYPNVKRFGRFWKKDLLPRGVCYVFKPEDVNSIGWFEKHGYDVALAAHEGIGRNGVKVVTLLSSDRKEVVIFYRTERFSPIVLQENGCMAFCRN